MLRYTLGLVAVSVASLGCSGRFEVGGVDPVEGAGGTRSVADGAASGSFGEGATATAGEPLPYTGGSMSAGVGAPAVGEPADEFGPQCVPPGPPPAVTGPFAKPSVVWSRISMLIWGSLKAPPSTLPTTTTYAWASDVVAEAFADTDVTGAQGAKLFVSQWLNLELGADALASMQGHYEWLLNTDTLALDVLLRAPLGETGRIGVFSEPLWLALHPGSTSRGAAMLGNVLQQAVPPPPPDAVGALSPEPQPAMTDRERMQFATNDPRCMACHQITDPVGFALGNFARDGAYRTQDRGLPVDTAGTIRLDYGFVEFDGIADFGAKMAERCQPTLALSDGFLRVALELGGFAQGDWEALFEANNARVRQAFVDGGRTYAALVTAFAQSPAVLKP